MSYECLQTIFFKLTENKQFIHMKYWFLIRIKRTGILTNINGYKSMQTSVPGAFFPIVYN